MSTLLKLPIHATPGAKRTEAAGEYGGALRVRLGAPPVDGKANSMLIDFLAREFAVSKRQVSLISGQQSRQKRVLIEAPQQLPAELGIARP